MPDDRDCTSAPRNCPQFLAQTRARYQVDAGKMCNGHRSDVYTQDLSDLTSQTLFMHIHNFQVYLSITTLTRIGINKCKDWKRQKDSDEHKNRQRKRGLNWWRLNRQSQLRQRDWPTKRIRNWYEAHSWYTGLVIFQLTAGGQHRWLGFTLTLIHLSERARLQFYPLSQTTHLPYHKTFIILAVSWPIQDNFISVFSSLYENPPLAL